MSVIKSVKSTCSYCGVGCGVVVSQHSNGTLSLKGDESHPSNKGMLCSKGMNLHYTAMDNTDRLLYPQIRMGRNHPFQNVSWDTALDQTAQVFKTFIQKYGPDSVAFYVSGQCLTEEYYVVNKLIKGFIGSNNIDTNSRLCMSSAVLGYKLSLGEDAVPICYDDIELADTFFVTGANPAWCHPILWRRVEAHKEANPHIKIIVVDPRKTQSASSADLHLAINPGTDITLNHAIGRILIEKNQIDLDFIANHVDGFEAYKTKVMEQTLAEAAHICGVPKEDIELAAKYIGEAKAYLSLWTMGLNQSVIGVNKNLSLINLHLITGQIGKPGSGPFSLTGQPNAMGGREVGGLANMLAAHRDLANETHREEVKTFWGGTVIQAKPGLTAVEMFNALNEGTLKAIWIICTNPLVSLPDLNKVEQGLKKAKFVVVQDISSKSDTLPFADVILPAAAWLEKEGTMTNSERRITYLPKLLNPPGQALPDAEILIKFAKKMGYEKAFNYEKTEDIYSEHVRLTHRTNINLNKLNYETIIQNRSVQWPFLNDGTSTKRLFQNKKFFTPNQKAQLHAVPVTNESEALSRDFPLILTTGRIRDQWHTMTKTGKVNKLKQHINEPYLEINPKDATQRQLVENDLAIIHTTRGEVKVKVKITEDIKPGVVFMPMHFGKIKNDNFGRTNNLTNSLFDPKSKEPDFKYAAVQVAKYVKPVEKIVIIGAGSAGLGFINSYRKLNQTDEIHVFSKEIYPFYNRVMLPDYISGHQSWEQLVKLREDQFQENNILVHKGLTIENIDAKNKVIVDSNHQEHHYDKLIIGTGSVPFMPPNVPKMSGIFNMRSRLDADNLMPFLKKPKAKAIIVGGGLLGIELAASLQEMNIGVTVIQRISRLMDRQLDPIGSDLLHQELIDKGIEIFYNDEVQLHYGSTKFEAIRLLSGRKIEADVIVYAIGTKPMVNLAQNAGLKVNRGVEVNDYLQTSDPNIFAMGEIAEWQSQMWGITAAAEQQAEIAASYISGDKAKLYNGSLSMNILKVQGLQLCSLGLIEAPNNIEYEEVIFIDKAKRYYKKCIIFQDKLVGAILIGDKSEFLEFKDLISKQLELSDKRLELLRSGRKADPVLGKLVCSCNNVGEQNIINCINAGQNSFEQICSSTGAGTGCGSCRPEIRAIMSKIEKLTLQPV